MSTAELKKKVIDKVDNINDDFILEELLSLIDFESDNDKVLKISDELKRKIDIGLQQIENGEVLSNEDVEKEIDEWLKE